MTSKERIYKILNFQTPDRIGIHDTFLNATVENWKTDGLPSDASLEDYFDLDLEIFDIDEVLSKGLPEHKRSERFEVLSFSEPFQRLCDIFGREAILRKFALYPRRLQAELAGQTDYILNSLQAIMQRGIEFDGAWVWGDLAYKGGLFFPPSHYKRLLFPFHKKIFQFLDSQNLFILFHSDGKISDLIPHLLDAGIRAFHPLEENSGMDIYKLVKAYKDDMVFMGHMDIERIVRYKDNFDFMREKIDMLKSNCFYIYHADYPIMPNISFKDYALLIEAVREYGTY